MTMRWWPVMGLLGALGCASEPDVIFTPGDAQVDTGAALDAGQTPVDASLSADVAALDRPDSGSINLDNIRVYANTSGALYAIDPERLTVTRIAAFQWPADGNSHEMTDIAVNAMGELWGITYNAIYRINPVTGRCFIAAPFDGTNFNGLSFIPGSELDGSTEILVAANRTGGVYRVFADGRTVPLGSYGSSIGSSGDIVSVASGGTFATVLQGGVEYLAQVNPVTGQATLVGETGQVNTWGLGYWRQRVFGFTSGGNFVSINIQTGRATLISNNGEAWWGAGVTTLAPTAPP